jgi:hypothetical protein
MQKIGKNLFICNIFLFTRISVLSGGTLPPGHPVQELPVPVFLARTGMSQNSLQGLLWHVALFLMVFRGTLAFYKAMATFFHHLKSAWRSYFLSLHAACCMLQERLAQVDWERYVNIAVQCQKTGSECQGSLTTSVKGPVSGKISFRGLQLWVVAQGQNFHRPVSRPLAVTG